MIRADEFEDVDADASSKEVVEFDLGVEEQALLHALDSDVEDAAVTCRPGKMFEVRVRREVPESVVASLQRAWEGGGWVVGVFEVADERSGRPRRAEPGSPEDVVFRVTFARPHKQLSRSASAKDVVHALEKREEACEFVPPDPETVECVALGLMPKTSTPLLVRMATRSRPVQALTVLQQYCEMAVGRVAIEVIIDEDDSTCNETKFLQQLAELDCRVTVGRHKNKIEACNAGRVDDWGVLVLASDDMVPVVRGYDQKILAAMERHFPLLDGALCFDDGYNKSSVRAGEPVTCTLPVMGRWLYEDYGRRVYWPEYRSIYCDTDQTFLFHAMNRMVFVDEVVVEHRHFANDKARFDELYQHNSKHDDHDRSLFEERRKRGFDAPELEVSILVCSIPPRRQQLERLVDYLRWQIRRVVTGNPVVEICVDLDPVATVGEKRQRLLERARGLYVCFVDDDDWVAHDYVDRLLAATKTRKDCASLVGVITEDGENPRRFEHSLKYHSWFTREDGVYARTPNHLNLIRREIALRVGFMPRNVGEDHVFSDRVKSLLKSEASTGDSALYFYWNIPSKSVQSGGAR